jgi:hypothetical protein
MKNFGKSLGLETFEDDIVMLLSKATQENRSDSDASI